MNQPSQQPLTRRCSKCHETKPLEMFWRDRTKTHGHEHVCKICQRTASSVQRHSVPAGYKRCSKCRQVKPIHAFRLNRRLKDGLDSWCRGCYRVRKLAYNAANWDKVAATTHNGRAERAGVEGRVTAEELTAKRAAQNGICVYCRRAVKKLCIDHTVPLLLGGRGSIDNIAFCCLKCNSSKGQRTPEQWINRWYEPRKGRKRK